MVVRASMMLSQIFGDVGRLPSQGLEHLGTGEPQAVDRLRSRLNKHRRFLLLIQLCVESYGETGDGMSVHAYHHIHVSIAIMT